jgi:hypothetical protein
VGRSTRTGERSDATRRGAAGFGRRGGGGGRRRQRRGAARTGTGGLRASRRREAAATRRGEAVAFGGENGGSRFGLDDQCGRI